ncbi:MAG TPA: thioredoxin domain-containing protein, partial [Sulfurimonas sp.]|nr:thioredoxin domain-containing protein [Sulfurimonas sp.]
NLLFLLRYWNRTNSEEALSMVEKTLDAMRNGGIYDHLGYGFHRYSTDPEWKVPHFEKMLYDQALIAMAYTEVYQATRKPKYAETVQEIFTYVLRDMTDSSGGFYSAEDADSEGEEGKFYVWDTKEINSILDGTAADLFNSVYTLSAEGNFTDEATGQKPGTNILYRSRGLQDIVSDLNIDEESSLEILENAREILFTTREERVHPYKDDKILTDWNGLMIAALSKGGRVLDKPEYIRAAQKTVTFIIANMMDSNGKLLHRYRERSAAINGNVDDYAFLIWGLLELYEATFNTQHLKMALILQDYLTEHFWDETEGGFYFTADNAEKLLIRQKEIYDGAIPSGNSVAMQNLLRLGRITSQPDLENMAAQIGRTFSSQVKQTPLGYTQLMSAVGFGVGPSYEIVIAGEINAQDTQAFLTAIRTQYMPNKVVLVRPTEDAPIVAIAPFTKNQNMIGGKATVYVCQNYACNLPTTDVAELVAQLGSK